MVVSLEQGADLHMPLPLTVSCISKIQIGFTFLVSAHPGSPGKRAVKRVCVCVCVCQFSTGAKDICGIICLLNEATGGEKSNATLLMPAL